MPHDDQRHPAAQERPRLAPEDVFVLWAHAACMGGGTLLLSTFLYAVGAIELPAALALFVTGGSLLSTCWSRAAANHRERNS